MATYSKVVKIDGTFDASQILKEIKKIQSAMEGNIPSGAFNSYNKLSKQLEKTIEIASKLETQVKAGFQDDKSIKNFIADLDKVSVETQDIYAKLKDLAKSAGGMWKTEVEKKVDESTKRMNQQFKTMQKTLKDTMKGFSTDEAKRRVTNALNTTTITNYKSLVAELEKIKGQQSEIQGIEEQKLKALKEELQISKALSYIKPGGLSAVQTLTGRERFANLVRGSDGNLVSNVDTIIKEEIKKALPQYLSVSSSAADLSRMMSGFWASYGLQAPKGIDYNAILTSYQGQEKYRNAEEALRNFSQTASEIFSRLVETARENAQRIGRTDRQREIDQNRGDTASAAMSSAATNLDNLGPAIDNATNSWSQYSAALQTAARNQQTIDSGFTALLNRLKYFFSLTTLFTQLRKQITQTFNDVKQLDKSFAEIAMVTKYEVGEMWGSYSQYAAMANRLGQATNDVIKASALYYQQGLETNEVLQLTEDTMKLATLASIDFSEATDLMTAAIRGFKLEMTEGSHVTDTYSELAAHAAASVQEIAVAMNKTAAIANSAGMSFENTAAFLTQMIEATQETAANIGTAMKTVVARFTELKENVDEVDSEFEDLDYNKVDKALKSIGVDLKDANGQFRDLDDVFIELSSRWQSLSRNQQRYIATTAAGSRQQSRFIALVDNYARTLELVDIAQNSAGRSSQQFAKYSDSVEYSIKKLQNTWEQFRVNLANNDFYKNFAENLNSFLERIASYDVIDWGKIATFMFTIGQTSMRQFIAGVQSASTGLRPIIENSLSNLRGDISSYNGFQRLLTGAYITPFNRNPQRLLTTLDTRRQELSNGQENWTPEQLAEYRQVSQQYYELRNNPNSEASREIMAAENASRFTPAARVQNMVGVGRAAGVAFSTAFITGMMTDDPGKVFSSTMISGAVSAIPNMMNTFSAAFQNNGGNLGKALGSALQGGLMSVATSLAIAAAGAAIKLIKKEIKEYQEKALRDLGGVYAASEKLEALKKDEQELGNAANKSAQGAEKAAEAYSQLASKGNELKNLQQKVMLTADEEERMVELSNEIAELAPTLISRYDEEGNAIVNLSAAYDQLIQKKEKILQVDQLVADKDASKVLRNEYEQASAEYEQEYWVGKGKEGELLRLFASNPLQYTNEKFFYGKQVAIGWASALSPIVGAQGYGANKLFANGEYTLNEAELKAVGMQLKTVLADTVGFEGLAGTSDAKAVEYVQSLVENSANQSEMIARIADAIENFEFDDEYNNYKLESKAQAYYDSLIQIRKDQLEKDSSLYAGADKNVQETMLSYLLGDKYTYNGAWSAFTSETGSNDYDKFVEWIGDNLTINKAQLSKVFTEEVIQVLSQIGELKLELPELIEYLKKNLSDTAFTAWLNTASPEIEAYNNKVKFLSGLLGSDVDKGSTLWTAKTNQDLVNGLVGIDSDEWIKRFQTWDLAGRRDEFLSLFEGLSSEDINKIFNFNWGKVSERNYQEQLDTLEKTVSANKGQIQKILDVAGFTDFSVRSTDELKDYVKEGMEDYKKYDKRIQAVRTAGTSWAKDGKVSAAGIEALYDQGFDIAKIVNDDLSFNTIEAEKQLRDMLEIELTSLEVKRAETVELANQYDIMSRMTGTAYPDSFLKKKGLTPELIAQNFTRNADGTFSPNRDYINAQQSSIQETLDNYDDITAALRTRIATIDLEIVSAMRDVTKEAEENAEKRQKAEKAVADAYKDILEKQQAVIDKQEELNKVLYGDEYHKGKLDNLYNYNTALEVFTDRIKEAKDELDDLDGRDPAEYLDEWFGGTHSQAATMAAENTRYEVALGNTRSMLENRLREYLTGLGRGISNNVSDYYYYDSNLDRYGINYGALGSAQMNDDLKDFIEEQVDLMNQYKKNIKKNQDDLKALEKEFNEYQKKVRDEYISVQEEVAKVLEEYYKKQVEDKKEMYEALEEADSEYIDALTKAIDKQRKLRDQQNAWNDLATKEKKLSLLSRDTSGANQKSIQSLQKEIRKDRESMLDNAVDTIIDELKEFYETQKETRETELEYQEALLENSNYIAEANSLLQSWKTVDEMREWMWAHTENIDKMSDEAVEKLTEDWADMFDAIQVYNEMSQREISTIFEVSSQEVQNIVNTTSETLTSEANRAFGEITNTVNEAIESAEKAVQDAMEALTKAQETYNEKIKELNEILTETTVVMRNLGAGNGSTHTGSAYVGGGEYTSTINSITEGHVPAAGVNAFYGETGWQNPQSGTGKQISIEDILPSYFTSLNSKAAQWSPRGGLRSYWVEGKSKREFLESQFGSNLIYAGDNESTIYAFLDEQAFNEYMTSVSASRRNQIRRYKKGGLANYTGLAMVDGTTTRPEAFLDAEDTARIGEAANIFEAVASLGTNGTLISGLSSVAGDTNATVNVYVESIATEDQVDYLIDRVKEEFVEAASPIGASIILHQ